MKRSIRPTNYHNYSFQSLRKHQLVEMVNAGHINGSMAQRIANMRGWKLTFKVEDEGERKQVVFRTMLRVGTKYNTIDQELLDEEQNGLYDDSEGE